MEPKFERSRSTKDLLLEVKNHRKDGPKLIERKWNILNPSSAENGVCKIRVMQWNILAQGIQSILGILNKKLRYRLSQFFLMLFV
jgi:hypothetical protein